MFFKYRNVLSDLILPIVLWGVIILTFLNVRNLPFDFTGNEKIVLRYGVKWLMTVAFPLALIYLIYKDKDHLGIYFPKIQDSFKLSLRALAFAGPAGMAFPLISWMGWTYADWYGAITLGVFYSIAFIGVYRFTRNDKWIELSDGSMLIFVYAALSLTTCLIAYFTYDSIPVLSKILYYLFIVGLGEELVFRGYLQSSFNRWFGKPWKIAGFQFGWGWILTSLLFGLIHALVVMPPAWPWALFTAVMGFILGYIREKESSIQSAVLLHAMMDMPLAFIS